MNLSLFFYDDHRAKCYGYPKDLEGIKEWIYNNKQYAKEVYLMFRKKHMLVFILLMTNNIYIVIFKLVFI